MTFPFSKQRFLVRFLFTVTVLLAANLYGQEPKPSVSWPTSFKLKRPAIIKLVQKGTADRGYIYRTKHFELHSPEALSEHNLSQFATTAESVPSVLNRLPLPLLGMPVDKSGKPILAKILIYPDELSFVKAGGAQGTAGYYDGWKQAILLRADTFLKPPRPANSNLPPRANYDLLVHEFTHLCMHRDLAYLPVWFTEGTAEYMSATHENNGVYKFTNVSSLISRYVKGGLPLDKDYIVLPGIVETMSLTHKSWRKRIEYGPAEDSYRPYATSLLLAHSLFHGGEKRRAATKLFLETVQKQKTFRRDKGRHNGRDKRQDLPNPVEILIPSAERESLQLKIVAYWKSRGLRIKFLPTPVAP